MFLSLAAPLILWSQFLASPGAGWLARSVAAASRVQCWKKRVREWALRLILRHGRITSYLKGFQYRFRSNQNLVLTFSSVFCVSISQLFSWRMGLLLLLWKSSGLDVCAVFFPADQKMVSDGGSGSISSKKRAFDGWQQVPVHGKSTQRSFYHL